MRHRKAGLKLNRTPSHRNAMFRNMVTSLFKYERIRTTGAKAKEIRRWADHLITLAKRGDLHARRQALAIVREKEVVHKLFEQADDRFGAVSGGYTRVVKLGNRPGDAAPMSLVELIFLEDTKKKKSKKKKTKTAGTPKKKAAAKKAPTGAEDVKADEKKTAAVKTETEPANKKEAVEAKAEKESVKKAAAETKSAAGDEKADKAEQKAKAATAEEKDTSDPAGKKTQTEKPGKEEK
jgi:large subunit ribosomal protein L17